MGNYRFERECRTAFSEVYLVLSDDDRIGRVDIHFTPSIVYATLCVGGNTTTEEIQDLIDVIDEELVMSADVARDDFIVTVYQGREIGVFSDEEFDEDINDESE